MVKQMFSRLLILMLLVSMVSVGRAPALSAQTVDAVMAFTVAEDATTYGLYIRSGGTDTRLKGISGSSINAFSVLAEASPDGRYVAYVPDFDGRFGTQLLVVRVKDNTEILSRQGYITDLVWNQNSDKLAYVSLDRVNVVFEHKAGDRAQVNAERPADPFGQVTVVDIRGRTTNLHTDQSVSRLLGFSADERTLYVTRVQQTPGISIDGFAHLQVSTGVMRDIVVSPLDGPFHYGFKLVPAESGEPLLAYATVPTLSASAAGAPLLTVASINGTGLRETRLTKLTYSDFLWDRGAQNVVVKGDTGIWTARADGSEIRPIAQGNADEWKLTSLDAAQNLLVQHAKSGLALFDAGASNALPEPRSFESDSVGIMGTVDLYAPYIHQVFDTATDFKNGGYNGSTYDGGKQDACGSTSSIIVMARLRYSTDSIYVEPSKFNPNPSSTEPSHMSDYGKYVSKQYTHTFRDFDGLNTSVTFSEWDYWSTGQGAHGHMVKSVAGTWYAEMEEFFSLQRISYNKSSSPTQTWVKGQIDQGRPVIAAMQYTGKSGGHLSVIKGYVTDSAGNITKWILHDTYGNAPLGGWGTKNNGANVQYDWSYMNVGTAWAWYQAY